MNEDYIVCKVCGGYYQLLPPHITRMHGLSSYEYQNQFPGAPVVCEELSNRMAENASNGITGRVPTQEHLDNMSKGMLEALDRDPTLRYRMGNNKRGVSKTEEHKQAIRETVLRNYKDDPTIAERISKTLTGGYLGEEHRENCRIGTLRAHLLDPTISERHSATNKKNWEDPLFAAMMIKSWAKKPNGPETALLEVLEYYWPGLYKLNVDGSQQYLLNTWGYRGRRPPDIVRTDGVRQVIFSHGLPWHEDDDDDKLVELFKPAGIKCLIFWENTYEDVILDWGNIKQSVIDSNKEIESENIPG